MFSKGIKIIRFVLKDCFISFLLESTRKKKKKRENDKNSWADIVDYEEEGFPSSYLGHNFRGTSFWFAVIEKVH